MTSVLLALAISLTAAGPKPVIIAHRGASGYLPEHTLEAVTLAHAQGADYIEQDLVLSKDGVPVVLHDVTLDATTDVARKFPDRKRPDGRWYAIDFNVGELKTLNVTERVDPRTGEAVFARRFPPGRGTFRIPTFVEELELIAGLNRTTGRSVGIYPELKAPGWHREQGVDLSKVVLEVLGRHGYRSKADACYVQCFEFDEVVRLRESLGYEGRLVYLIGGRRGFDPTSPEGLDRLAKLVDGIGPPLPMVVRAGEGGELAATDLARNARARGLSVHPWTVRVDALPGGAVDVDEVFDLLLREAGADGVFTDHPDAGARFVRNLSEK